MKRNCTVTVIDYGVGNLLSVRRGLEHVGAKVVFSADPVEILSSERVILPGVGAFKSAMVKLEKLELTSTIKTLVDLQIPLLGICLGMEILFESSEEFGSSSGLGLIPGEIVPISNKGRQGETLKLPHIGWNSLNPNDDLPILDSANGQQDFNGCMGKDFYFVHSYMARPSNPEDCLAYATYGVNQIPAIVKKGVVYGVQFHPEKSGIDGLGLLETFIQV